MPTATITAKYVNPPQEGKKNGTIKTPEGVYYGLPANWVNQFTQGASYDVEYKENDFKGKTYKTITKFAMSQAAPAQTNSGAASGKYGATDDKTAERIFCCGALNAAIHSGKVELRTESLAGLTNILRDVWALTFGAAPRASAPTRQPLNEEIGDDVPY
jgi:hypothetical protein